MNVAILGASQKPERYSYKALKLLIDKGHFAFPVHPLITMIGESPAYKRLVDIPAPIHTITVYMGPERSNALADDIMALSPSRVILNPGAENPDLTRRLKDNGVEVLNACTLVLLNTGQFDLYQMGLPERIGYNEGPIS